MAKKLTSTKAKKILHDKEVHGHPLTEQQRKFFGAIAGGAKPYKVESGGWLDKFDAPQAQNGIEGTMGGLTDKGFNFNPAWGGAWRDGGDLPKYQTGDTFTPYSRDYLTNFRDEWVKSYNQPIPYALPTDDRFDKFYLEKRATVPEYYETKSGWVRGLGTGMEEFREGDKNTPPRSMGKPAKGFEWVENYKQGPFKNESQISEYTRLIRSIRNAESRKPVWNRDVKFNFKSGGILQPPMAGANQTVPMAQTGTRQPIYTSDPRDPRLRAYQDSLSAFNSNAKWAKFWNKDLKDYVQFSLGTDNQELVNKINSNIKTIQINDKNAKLDYPLQNDFSFSNKDVPAWKNQYIGRTKNLPIAIGRQYVNNLPLIGNNSVNNNGSSYASVEYPIFKKPVQPVEYRKHILEKPSLSVDLPNIELTDVRPTIAQPTFEQARVDMSKPTKYSYTYPTFDQDVQKTMYFPDRNSWKTFVEQQRGASSQEGKDYGSATGQFAMGGSIPGSVGFTYARVSGAAPSEGPYAKKTLPSAQNGAKIPVIEDEGSFTKDGIWIPDWDKMTAQAKKLGAKKVRTKHGSVIYFNDKWEVSSVDDNPGAKAQNGQEMKFYQEGLDFTPKTISKNGGWLNKYDAPQAQTGKMLEYLKSKKTAPVVTKGEPMSEEMQKRITAETLRRQTQKNKPLTATNTREQAVERGRAENLRVIEENKEYDRQAMAEGKAAEATRENPNVPFTFPTGESKLWKDMDRREQQYVSGRNLGSMSRSNNWTDWINPITMIGEMGEGLATAPYMARETDSNLPYIAGIVSPLLGGALGGRGTKSVGQFANSMLNPLAGIGSSSGAPAKGSIMSTLKGLKVNDNIKFDFTDRLNTGVESYTQGLASGAIELGLSPLAKLKGKSTRSFGEIFPRTAQEKFIAKQQSEKASSVGEQFVKDWTYDESGWVRPEIAKRINAITSSGASQSPYAGVLNNYTMFDQNNPLSYTPNIMTSTRYSNVVNNRNLNDLDKIRILSNRGDAAGINFDGDFPASFTFENMGPYEYSYPQKLSTAVHEGAHTMQELGFPGYGFGKSLAYFDPEYKYFVPNTATDIGAKFAEVMPTPRKGKDNWKTSPLEMHSELMTARQKLVDKYTKSGTGYQDALATVRNATDKDLDWMIDRQRLNRFFKKDVSPEKKREMLRLLPAAVPAVGAASMLGGESEESPKRAFQYGGDIPVDPMGYWNPDNVGSPVIIPSTDITMEGVDQPLVGVSDTGDVQYMMPGEDYEFDGEYVTEYPVAKKGISVNNADAQPLKKLDQLLNFTNYNKPTKGGWLDKYN